MSQYDQIVVECEIPKEAITDVGVQNGMTTIVTPEFTIVGEDKFLEQRK